MAEFHAIAALALIFGGLFVYLVSAIFIELSKRTLGAIDSFRIERGNLSRRKLRAIHSRRIRRYS